MKLEITLGLVAALSLLTGCNQGPKYDLKANCDRFLSAIEAEVTDDACTCIKDTVTRNYSSEEQIIIAKVFADASRVAENGQRVDIMEGPFITINSNFNRSEVRAFSERLIEDTGKCQ